MGETCLATLALLKCHEIQTDALNDCLSLKLLDLSNVWGKARALLIPPLSFYECNGLSYTHAGQSKKVQGHKMHPFSFLEVVQIQNIRCLFSYSSRLAFINPMSIRAKISIPCPTIEKKRFYFYAGEKKSRKLFRSLALPILIN